MANKLPSSEVGEDLAEHGRISFSEKTFFSSSDFFQSRSFYYSRTFSDLLGEWISSDFQNDADRFLRETGLSGTLSKEGLIELIGDKKAPTRELADFFAAVVPSHVSTPLVFWNRGHRAAARSDPDADHPLEAVELKSNIEIPRQFQLERIKSTARMGSSDAANVLFMQWIVDQVDGLSQRMGIEPNLDNAIKMLSAHVNLTEKEFRGESRIPEHRVAAAAEKLAGLFNLGTEEYDFAVGLMEAAWNDAGEWQREMAFPQSMRFLRHSHGMTQNDFYGLKIGAPGTSYVNVERCRNPSHPEMADVLTDKLGLAKAERDMLAKGSDEFAFAMRESLQSHVDGLVSIFPENEAVLRRISFADTNYMIFMGRTPKKQGENIRAVVTHFSEQGMDVEHYLGAAVSKPWLFNMKPEKAIRWLDDFIALYKRGGVVVPGPSIVDFPTEDLQPLMDFWKESPVRLAEALTQKNPLFDVCNRVTGVRINYRYLKHTAVELEDFICGSLGYPDSCLPIPALMRPEGFSPETYASLDARASSPEFLEYARNMALRSLVEEGLINRELEYAPHAERVDWRDIPLKEIRALDDRNMPQGQTLINGSEEAVVKYFGDDGLTKMQFHQAMMNLPELYNADHRQVIKNVELVVEALSKFGVTKRSYLKAATACPELFLESETDVRDTIMKGWRNLPESRKDRMKLTEYVEGALTHPSLFLTAPSDPEETTTLFRARLHSRKDLLYAPAPLARHEIMEECLAKVDYIRNHFPHDNASLRDMNITHETACAFAVVDPDTAVANIRQIVERLESNGLSATYLLQAAVSDPRVLTVPPEAAITRITQLTDDYTRAAIIAEYRFTAHNTDVSPLKVGTDFSALFERIADRPRLIVEPLGEKELRREAIDCYSANGKLLLPPKFRGLHGSRMKPVVTDPSGSEGNPAPNTRTFLDVFSALEKQFAPGNEALSRRSVASAQNGIFLGEGNGRITQKLKKVVGALEDKGLEGTDLLDMIARCPDMLVLPPSQIIKGITCAIEAYEGAVPPPENHPRSVFRIMVDVLEASPNVPFEEVEWGRQIPIVARLRNRFANSEAEVPASNISDRAAQEEPQSDNQPATLQVDRVVNQFWFDGLKKADLMDAMNRSSSVGHQTAEAVIHNIASTVATLSPHGLTTRDYLAAAIEVPTLFELEGKKVLANLVEGQQILDEGFTLTDYVAFAIKHPLLFKSPSQHLDTREQLCELAGIQPPEPPIAPGLPNQVGRSGTLLDYLDTIFLPQGTHILGDVLVNPEDSSALENLETKTAVKNVDDVIQHFKDRGMNPESYLGAIAKKPGLLALPSEPIVQQMETALRLCLETLVEDRNHELPFVKNPWDLQRYVSDLSPLFEVVLGQPDRLAAGGNDPVVWRKETSAFIASGKADSMIEQAIVGREYMVAKSALETDLFNASPMLDATRGLRPGDATASRDPYAEIAKAMPQLFKLYPEKIIGSIETIVGHFRDQGLTTAAYIEASIADPRLLILPPDAILSTFEQMNTNPPGDLSLLFDPHLLSHVESTMNSKVRMPKPFAHLGQTPPNPLRRSIA